MGSLSNYAETKLVTHTLLGAAWTMPSGIYVAASTADPGEDGSGIAEPSGNGYARVAFSDWVTVANRTTRNNSTIAFPQATGNWGTITHVALFDASTGGNMLAYDDLAVAQAITSGYTLRLDPATTAGQLTVSFNTGGVSTYLANAWLKHALGIAAYTKPTVTYVGLATSNPGDAGSLTGEPSGNGYARQQVTDWGVSGNAGSNQAALTFGPASGGNWGTVSHSFVADASSAGNVLFYAGLGVSGAVNDGGDAQFAAGDFDVTLD